MLDKILWVYMVHVNKSYTINFWVFCFVNMKGCCNV
jgi:hypothetical protein